MQRVVLIYLLTILSVSINAQQLSKEDEKYIDSLMNANYKSGEPGEQLFQLQVKPHWNVCVN